MKSGIKVNEKREKVHLLPRGLAVAGVFQETYSVLGILTVQHFTNTHFTTKEFEDSAIKYPYKYDSGALKNEAN